MNCFKIGCFSFEERLGVHMKITRAAHNARKTVGIVLVEFGLELAVGSKLFYFPNGMSR